MAATAATSTTTACRRRDTHRRRARRSPPKLRVETPAPGVQTADDRDDVRPAGGAVPPDRASRSAATCAERIVSTVTLTDGVPRIDIETTIVSTRPKTTGCASTFHRASHATVSKADQHFGVIQRPLALPGVGPGDLDGSSRSAPTRRRRSSASMTARLGLTIANRGLPEYEVLDTPDGAEIAVTLIRCVGWLSRNDLYVAAGRRRPAAAHAWRAAAGAQRRRVQHHPAPRRLGERRRARAGRAVPASMRARWDRRGIGRLPASSSLLKVSSPAFHGAPLSSGRRMPMESSCASTTRSIGRRRLAVDLTPLDGAVSLVNLNEEEIAGVPRVDGEIPVQARTNEIVTLRFRPQSPAGATL